MDAKTKKLVKSWETMRAHCIARLENPTENTDPATYQRIIKNLTAKIEAAGK